MADRAVMDADRMHRHRLETAWLHGTTRTSADRMSAWPWALAGLLAVVLIIAGLGIAAAYRAQKVQDQHQRRTAALHPGALKASAEIRPMLLRGT